MDCTDKFIKNVKKVTLNKQQIPQSRVEVLQSRVEVLQSRVEVLQSRVEVLQSRVEVLQHRVEVLDDEFSCLNPIYGEGDRAEKYHKYNSTIGVLFDCVKKTQLYLNLLESFCKSAFCLPIALRAPHK
ncbi:hypothetical protein [Nostoc sp.]|uniref:hypothetical protein n=1 Tax=Nostoc sp. TaxID=1180 RepID=UPI002FF7B724